MSYQIHTTASGLRIASEQLPHMETVALAISVDVGARHESNAQHGISHLLEHMAFKGTPRFSALKIAEIFDAIGGHLNAYTSHEHTVYYAKVLKDHLPLAADVLADIIQHSLFDEDELEKEKHVILQELAMHHDTPDDLVFDYFQQTAFPDQPLGRSILGTAEQITTHGADDIRRFVADHYRAPHIVISAAGNLSHAHLTTLSETHFDGLNTAPHDPVATAIFHAGQALIEKDLEQLQLVMGMPALPVTDTRYPVLSLLSTLLGGGMSSRLFQEIREKRGLVYSIQSMVSSYADVGMFGIYAATGEHQTQELLDVTCDVLHRLPHTLTDDELERAKQQQIAGLRMARESTAGLAEWIGRHLLHYGEYRDTEHLSRTISAVTTAQLRDLACELFLKPQICLAALGPVHRVPGYQSLQSRLAA